MTRRWALVAVTVAGLAGLSGPALARRDEEPPRQRGCSGEEWRIVIEEDDRYRLCLLARDAR